MTELFENPFMKIQDDFLKSPAEAPTYRKVLLEEKTFPERLKKLLNNCLTDMITSYPKTVATLAKPC